jgi:nucleotide sugar dehydrogenase
MNLKVLIAGYGNIGKHLHRELNKLNPDIYDKFIPEYTSAINNHYDVAFVCVPTEMSPDGSADISVVEEVISELRADVINIRSAVPVGTCEMLTKKYGKNLVVSPEYYGTTQHSSDSPNFLILGGDINHARKIAQLYHRVKSGSFRIRFTDHKTAELAKYMENCFLALKVTFCAEFKQIADSFGIVYEDLRECFVMDERMGDSHTFVYDETPYYDSHCLNKDIPALIHFANNPPLMTKMDEINKKKKKQEK